MFNIVAPKIKLSESVFRVLPGYKLSCSATGTLPVYTAIIRNSTILINTTRHTAEITLNEEGNYTGVATSKYGTDAEEVSVIFTGKENILLGGIAGNTRFYFASKM